MSLSLFLRNIYSKDLNVTQYIIAFTLFCQVILFIFVYDSFVYINTMMHEVSKQSLEAKDLLVEVNTLNASIEKTKAEILASNKVSANANDHDGMVIITCLFLACFLVVLSLTGNSDTTEMLSNLKKPVLEFSPETAKSMEDGAKKVVDSVVKNNGVAAEAIIKSARAALEAVVAFFDRGGKG